MSALSPRYIAAENDKYERDIQSGNDVTEQFHQFAGDILDRANKADTDEMRTALRGVRLLLLDFIHDFVVPDIGGAKETLEERVREI